MCKVELRSHPLPPVLYHYTDIQGLHGILTSAQWHATHYRYQNDVQEIIYGDNLAKNELKKHIDKAASEWARYTFEETLGVEYGPPSVLKAWDYDIYLNSFSEEGNLLEQWRAYGDNGEGYSIGINPENLLHEKSRSPNTDVDAFVFVKVEYDVNTQRTLIEEAIEKIYPLLDQGLLSCQDDFARKSFCASVAKHLSFILVQLSFSYKHPAFAQEREWRIVKLRWGRNVMKGQDSDAVKDVFYRPSKKKILIPYLKLDFQSYNLKGLLPLVEIILGPKHKYIQEDAINSLKMQLISLGYEKHYFMPEFRVSDIPYQ